MKVSFMNNPSAAKKEESSIKPADKTEAQKKEEAAKEASTNSDKK
jgi:hypothetical protein